MTLRRSGHVEAVRRAALITFALATCALVVVGTVMLGFTSAAHTATESHVQAEVAIEASGGVPVHDGGHALTGMHLAGVCAAVLAALAAVALAAGSWRCITSTASSATAASRQLAATASRATGPPPRTALCVQLC
jgi:lysylphosphatidylglycerol synthetase-like protein (DUF2156 family)